jgi:hypothetical protein
MKWRLVRDVGPQKLRYGIELEGLKYNSQELGELRRRMGATVKVKLTFDPGDLGRINVLVPSEIASRGIRLTGAIIDITFSASWSGRAGSRSSGTSSRDNNAPTRRRRT